jgi:hypothetical protein
MQQDSLLEQLDWCFTSINWISDYPNTLLIPLAKTTSDHVPCMVQISTSIPKAKIFKFENYWVEQMGFMDIVKSVGLTDVRATNSATRVVAKFKQLRKVLKKWAKGLSKLKEQIKQCNAVLLIMDKLEENRDLYPPERNFRQILKKTFSNSYIIRRFIGSKGTLFRWTKVGVESTKFFHAATTEGYRLNTITSPAGFYGLFLKKCWHIIKEDIY